ncbi:MAG TPA: DUF6084 family protein [Blastocatellia bacterium]
MPDLTFDLEGAEAVQFAAAPTLAFKLRIGNRIAGEPIHTIVLRVQIMVEQGRRRYTSDDQRRLVDLFGEPDRWGQTLRPMLWTHSSVVVPGFTDTVAANISVPCTFDFNVAATKYFAGVESGDIPLNFLFSGTIFYETQSGALQISQIPWDREATFRLPVATWNRMMDFYYPNSAWLALRKDVFERLYHYKLRRGFPTWEQTIESILPEQEIHAESEEGEESDGHQNIPGPDGGERVH